MDPRHLNICRSRLQRTRSFFGRLLARWAVRALVNDGTPEAARVLASSLGGIPSPVIRSFARDALARIKDQSRINAICAAWLESHGSELLQLILESSWLPTYPRKLEVAVALATNREFKLNFADPAVIHALIEFCSDVDSLIALNAKNCLATLHDQRAIDTLCGVWADTRNAVLGEVIATAKYLASDPIPVRVLTVLKAGTGDDLAAGRADVATALLRAANDTDPVIGSRARAVLHQLTDADAREAVCNAAIESDNAIAREIAVQANYLPRDEVRRAVFHFLTEQWDRYDELDFDRRLLAAAYEAGDRKLRCKIAEAARRAGRAEWIQLLAGVRQERRLNELSDEEWDAALAVLEYNQRWPEMWRLAQSAPPDWSLRLVATLQKVRWTPEQERDRAGFEQVSSWGHRCREEPPFLGRLIRAPEVIELHSAPVTCVGMTRNGNLVASGSHDGTVRLRNISSQNESQVLHGHTDWITCVRFSPNDRFVASASNDGTVRLWEVPAGLLVHILKGHAEVVRAVAFTPDGRFVASASEDKTARLWRVPEGDPAAVLGGHHDVVSCIAISPNGEFLATGCYDSEIRLWRLPEGQLVGTFFAHRALVTSLGFTPDSQQLISGSKDRTLIVWDLPTGTKRNRLKAHSDDVSCFAISPDGRYLASGSWDTTVRLWSLPDGGLIETLGGTRTMEGHSAWVNCLSFSPDGRVLASGAVDNTIRLWSVPGGAPLKSLEDHSDRVSCLVFSSDGRVLVSGGWDGKVCLWKSELARLRRIPIGQIVPRDQDWLEKTLVNSMLDGAERNWLEFVMALIRWRRRYDIQIEEPRIAVGEFDIEIET